MKLKIIIRERESSRARARARARARERERETERDRDRDRDRETDRQNVKQYSNHVLVLKRLIQIFAHEIYTYIAKKKKGKERALLMDGTGCHGEY